MITPLRDIVEQSYERQLNTICDTFFINCINQNKAKQTKKETPEAEFLRGLRLMNESFDRLSKCIAEEWESEEKDKMIEEFEKDDPMSFGDWCQQVAHLNDRERIIINSFIKLI